MHGSVRDEHEHAAWTALPAEIARRPHAAGERLVRALLDRQVLGVVPEDGLGFDLGRERVHVVGERDDVLHVVAERDEAEPSLLRHEELEERSQLADLAPHAGELVGHGVRHVEQDDAVDPVLARLGHVARDLPLARRGVPGRGRRRAGSGRRRDGRGRRSRAALARRPLEGREARRLPPRAPRILFQPEILARDRLEDEPGGARQIRVVLGGLEAGDQVLDESVTPPRAQIFTRVVREAAHREAPDERLLVPEREAERAHGRRRGRLLGVEVRGEGSRQPVLVGEARELARVVASLVARGDGARVVGIRRGRGRGLDLRLGCGRRRLGRGEGRRVGRRRALGRSGSRGGRDVPGGRGDRDGSERLDRDGRARARRAGIRGRARDRGRGARRGESDLRLVRRPRRLARAAQRQRHEPAHERDGHHSDDGEARRLARERLDRRLGGRSSSGGLARVARRARPRLARLRLARVRLDRARLARGRLARTPVARAQLGDGAPDRLGELLRALEAIGGTLAESLGADRVERVGHSRADGARRRRLALEDLRVDGAPHLGLERPLAGQALVEDRPEREDVGARVHLVRAPLDLLRREVVRRPEDQPGAREVGPGGGVLRQPEVDDPRAARPLLEDHVRGLEVAVEDAVLVRVLDPGEDPLQHLARAPPRQRARLQHVAERLAGDQLHGEREDVLVAANVVDVANIGVRQARGRSTFAHEALEHGRVEVGRRADHLERDEPVEVLVARLEDDAVAAATELALHLIAVEVDLPDLGRAAGLGRQAQRDRELARVARRQDLDLGQGAVALEEAHLLPAALAGELLARLRDVGRGVLLLAARALVDGRGNVVLQPDEVRGLEDSLAHEELREVDAVAVGAAVLDELAVGRESALVEEAEGDGAFGNGAINVFH